MIEDVEHFEAEIQRCGLGKFRILLDPGIGVDGPGTAEAVLRRTAGHPAQLVATGQTAGERRWIEEVIPVTRYARKTGVARVYFLDGTDLGRIVKPEVGQSKVPAALQTDRRTAVETRDAGEMPAAGNAARTEQTRERQFPVVAQDQIVTHIES